MGKNEGMVEAGPRCREQNNSVLFANKIMDRGGDGRILHVHDDIDFSVIESFAGNLQGKVRLFLMVGADDLDLLAGNGRTMTGRPLAI